MKFTKILSLSLLAAASLLSSCLKQEYDAPPDSSHYDPMLPVNVTLRELANDAMGNLSSGQSRVLGDSTTYGVVIGDDRSGNIYKQIIIEDTAGGGMVILIDKTTIYGDLPVGRKVYVNLKGLRLFNYNGLPQIVYDIDNTGRTLGIPSVLLENFIIKASFPNYIEPKLVTMIDVFSNSSLYLNTLIKMDDMQFAESSANVLFSDPSRSTTRYINDCPFNGTLGMYNSAYSNFQAAITPNGKGSIVGILSTYNSPQFLLRDTTDIQFTNTRVCQ